MVLNNFQTIEHIREVRNEKLSQALVLHLHAMLTRNTLPDPQDCGRLRMADDIHVADFEDRVIHIPPPAKELEARLDAMCEFANGDSPSGFLHPVLRAVILHFWLAYDHPFVDGNGRCARALFYWSMLRQGYWLCEYLSISQVIHKARQQYYRAFLHTETDDNDLTYFILYHLDVIWKAIEELHKNLQRKAEEVRRAESLLRGFAAFNHRQRELLQHALRHPGHRYTIEGHRRSHNVVYQTARTDLLDLSKKGLMKRIREGRAWVFVPSHDFERKLAAPR
jgi:Fic family protein